uniref:caspase-1-A-like isoform X2 n=1 Tax=Epinephelus lanceolatus TaxID=310571 RepID=UPI0014486B7D|nr:caspase-1-A-like isoform X2 [Epinephelus lanceolatus]
MAVELGRVRRKFVDKVSKVLIKQLLDDLLDDGVLNDGQKDSIVEEYSATADKARVLIDTVKKKGDEASRKLIAHIHSRDSTLYSELGLSCVQPAQPAAVRPSEQEWSITLNPATESFWMDKVKDNNVYPVDKKSIKNRVALLITNIKFTDEKMNRNGADKDEENMEKLLTALKYEVVKYTNLTGKAIDDAILKFSKHPKLKETDSVIVVIMSHGKLGKVLGVDWKKGDEKPDEFLIDNIYKHLGSEKCPALLDKPKIIIIQACRGEEEGSAFVRDVVSDDASQSNVPPPADEDNLEADTVKCVHKEKDFTALLSCTPDTVSYRQRDLGSFLIQYIVEVFNTFAHKDDIEELFRKMMSHNDPPLSMGATGSDLFPEHDWIKLEPEVNCVDADDAPTYSLQSEAGAFECSVSGLCWVCKEKVSFRYQFGSWEGHLDRMKTMQYIPGGPLLDITVIAGKLDEAHLPHWICTEDNPTVLDKFAVLHIDTCGDIVIWL